MVTQLHSISTSEVEQGALTLLTPGPKVDVPQALIDKQPSLLAAIRLCINSSGLDDKQVQLQLGIDSGHFSNLMKGKGHFPPDKLNALMDLCGNEAPLKWLARSRGYALVVLKSEAERRAEEAEQRAARAEQKLAWAMETIQTINGAARSSFS